MVSDILPDIVYYISQAGFLPPLDKEAAGIITGSEAIIKEFASKHSLSASTINSFIKDVLKNPAFNADEVRLAAPAERRGGFGTCGPGAGH